VPPGRVRERAFPQFLRPYVRKRADSDSRLCHFDSPMIRQHEQQPQRAMWSGYHQPCPSCPRMMRLVGRENGTGSKTDLLTFQCDCGQIFAAAAHH